MHFSQPNDALRSYLRTIRRLSGVASVALYLPASTSQAKPTLLQDGDGAPVPELANLDTSRRVAEESAPSDEKEAPATLLASREQDCILVRLASLPRLLSSLAGSEEPPRRRIADVALSLQAPIWIGLRFSSGRAPFALLPGERLKLEPQGAPPPDDVDWWLWLFALGGALAWHQQQETEILADPVTGLPGRHEFHGRLAKSFDLARESKTPLSLLLVNPDGFATVNERFGRETGDRVLRKVANQLSSCLRNTDLVAKYGGAIFACILSGSHSAGALQVAEKALANLAEAPYLDGALGLGFSVGIATYHPEQAENVERDLELVRRADQALSWAKRQGGGRCATWRPDLELEAGRHPVELSGIFTGNMTKDYRNMALLSETMAAVAASRGLEELAARVVEKLSFILKAERTAIFRWRESGEPQLLKGFSKSSGDAGDAAELVFPADVRSLVDEARVTGTLVFRSANLPDTGVPHHAYAVPLVVAAEAIGCLYLDGTVDSLDLDSADHALLRGIASQLGIALDRARLNAEARARQLLEQERLQTELEHLREALQQAKLEYRSQQMEAVLSTLRRVAPTDATVLITGESGTGKELMARTVHQLSSRRSKPLVIVDCGAIPTTLMESELFGHERGSFTGADKKKSGRLVEANDGTVLLDEIGELPLEVQAKLLRFVQERQVTPVGATRSRSVDVRVVAATNRDLKTEVEAGRFREDLYYRLNVVRLHVPALRERPEDILHLANHFLSTYALLYNKPVRKFTPDAEAAILRHAWPGNVRELQNQIQQSVILSSGTELAPEELTFLPELQGDGEKPPLPRLIEAAPEPREVAPDELWQRLRVGLQRHIETSTSGASAVVPLGRWLGDDLILEADRAAGGIASRAATRLGIPETTFRRRRGKVQAEIEAGLAPRPEFWSPIRETLAALARCNDLDGAALLERSQRLLLELIVESAPKDVKTGARILGVTAPTYRRRLDQLQEHA